MTNQEKYDALIKRYNAPENSEVRQKFLSKADETSLTFRLKRITTYMDCTDNAKKEQLELDYAVSLNDAKKLMDEQGWK